jgi:RNA polymerase sigma-70 factor, ECF subfamily
VTRLCIDHLRAARVRREFADARLAEPPPAAPGPDPLEAVILAESLSAAARRVLERLTAAERVVFLLREVFSFGYPEVAEVVGKSEVACRQLAHRARERVAIGAPRFAAADALAGRVEDGFVDAWASGDVEALVGLLTADATPLERQRERPDTRLPAAA